MRKTLLELLLFCAMVVGLKCNQNAHTQSPSPAIGPRTEVIAEDKYHKIFYISPSGSDADGTGSKSHPWQTLSFALLQINDAVETSRYAIYSGQGTYSEKTITLKPYVDLYGGFNSSNWQRDIFKYPSILNGSRKFRVLIGTDHARLDGYFISRGWIRGKGGGLLCDSSSPVVTNNIFSYNKTLAPEAWNPNLRHEIANDGGAIYAYNGAKPIIKNNIFFKNNTEIGRGAGISLHSKCGGEIANNVFMYNRAGLVDPMRSSDGGAISIFEWSRPIIENNIILENEALTSNDGGGIFSAYWSSPQILKNVFVGNYCGDDGGGLFTAGQNHHDEIPPLFDTIPDKKDFYIHIRENVFIGNNEALEFTMESKGVFADNIVAHNGEKSTHPAGVYFQRSEAHIINNTILDPFLMNFKTFDAKQSSDGLGPSIIRNNHFYGRVILDVEATLENNFILDDHRNNSNMPPNLANDWMRLNADAVYYDQYLIRQIFTTRLLINGGSFQPDALIKRVIKAGNRWGVIKSNTSRTIDIWGNLTGEVDFLIFPGYYLK
jgi:hypothetical protein